MDSCCLCDFTCYIFLKHSIDKPAAQKLKQHTSHMFTKQGIMRNKTACLCRPQGSEKTGTPHNISVQTQRYQELAQHLDI